MARAIVEERSRVGPFQRVEDLDRVPGVGPASLARLTPYLEVNGRAGATTSSRQTGRQRASPNLAASPRPNTGPLDLNRASADELSRLPGIGPTLAARIVEARKRRGAFRSVDDLLDVPGIGPATLARVRSGVVVRR
ncbi:MAG: helix-hairpin-helix domain-containing protein [Gemmatimonadetes bacterium]|nr:helix-hairpin-helix domain-containing protein [Gemmatimonadota bacterium]